MSHPSRVCGLKYEYGLENINEIAVAPFAGVWIEIHLDGEQLNIT